MSQDDCGRSWSCRYLSPVSAVSTLSTLPVSAVSTSPHSPPTCNSSSLPWPGPAYLPQLDCGYQIIHCFCKFYNLYETLIKYTTHTIKYLNFSKKCKLILKLETWHFKIRRIEWKLFLRWRTNATEVIESFFLDESESEYYSLIRKFSNPNPNIIRDFKKDSNIFESLKRFEYSNIIRII